MEKLNFKRRIIVRFAPECNWNLHIGHLKNIITNLDLSKIYNGKTNFRIDDTNPKKNKKKYKINIIKNIIFIIKNNEKKINKNKIFHTSNYFFKLYQYLEIIIKIKKKQKILKKIRDLLKGKYKEKKKIIKIFKKQIAYRNLYIKHWRTNYNWFIYPIYDYSHNIADKIENISYSICGEEFKKNRKIYNIILNILYKKKKPKQIEIKKKSFKKNILSKSKLKKIIKKKYIKNSKDLRLKTLSNIKTEKFKKIIFFFKKIIKKNIIKKKNLKRENKFIKIKITNFPKNKIIINKKKYLNKILFIKKNLFIKLKKNSIKATNLKKNFLLKKTKYIINCYKIIKKRSLYLKCKIYRKKKNLKKIEWFNKIYKKEIILNNKYDLVKKKNINIKGEKKILLIKKIKKNNKIIKKNLNKIKIKKTKLIFFSTLYDSNV